VTFEGLEKEEIGASLRKDLDRLATNVLVGATSDGAADVLREFSERASADGFAETSRAAARILEQIRDSPGASKESSESMLSHDLVQLQAVLESESRPQALSATSQNTKSGSSLADDPELVGDFIVESREHLSSIEGQMLSLEQNPGDVETIHAVFRSFHTIKGLAGFLEFQEIRDVAHEVETLLDLVRDGKLTIVPGIVDVVLESADYLNRALGTVESWTAGEVEEPFADNQNLIYRIQLSTGTAQPEQEILQAGPSDVGAAVSRAATGKTSENFSVRVETSKLDYLMDMVGEMVIAQSLIRNNPSLAVMPDARLAGDLTQLARITSEVQRTAMGMRMIPIGQLFQRTGRLIRDLSRKAGKRVEFETDGADTDLDKTIAEELSDPLMHMVRNSIDHGIELPEDRLAAGKDPVARVRLAAYHNGGQIVIEISDDGRGLDREKILRKAHKNGLITDGSHLSDNEVFNLIFEPGFSTAEQVTDISGRGVGMDVVRKHVQKLRGRIEILSKPGQGATFFLKLPLTLAIIDGLVVGVGRERYIVPIFAVKELFRPTSETISTIQGRDEMALVRGRLLPVVRLHQYFGVQPKSSDPCEGLLLVAECQEKLFCLLVDELAGKQEVVIKSLGETLKNIPGIAGGAILGDGRVGMILDMEGVYRRGKP
jgi:two-component system, chemotaxis family, sensor kinase CheA